MQEPRRRKLRPRLPRIEGLQSKSVRIGYPNWSRSLPRTVAAAVRLAYIRLSCRTGRRLLDSWLPDLCLLRERRKSRLPTQPSRNNQRAIAPPRCASFWGLAASRMPRRLAEGAKLFGPACAFCHGADARGGTGPDLLRSSTVLDDDQGELVGAVVRKGIPDKGMPAFPAFTDEQLRDLAEFLHLQVYLAANRGTYEIQNIVTGNPKAGEAYFNGEGKCNTCHSPAGDLAHIGSKLRAPDLQQALLYPGSVGPRATPQVTSCLEGWEDGRRHPETSR